MNKIRIIISCLLLPFIIFIAFTFWKIKSKEVFKQKTVLAYEIRKVLGYLMLDLREAREGSFIGLPVDGQWHERIAFKSSQLGDLEYIIQNRHLFRVSNGQQKLIADNIGDLRIRRQRSAPDIVEVQIEARNSVSLESNLRIRIRD